jgi:hypothetical protein
MHNLQGKIVGAQILVQSSSPPAALSPPITSFPFILADYVDFILASFMLELRIDYSAMSTGLWAAGDITKSHMPRRYEVIQVGELNLHQPKMALRYRRTWWVCAMDVM